MRAAASRAISRQYSCDSDSDSEGDGNNAESSALARRYNVSAVCESLSAICTSAYSKSNYPTHNPRGSDLPILSGRQYLRSHSARQLRRQFVHAAENPTTQRGASTHRQRTLLTIRSQDIPQTSSVRHTWPRPSPLDTALLDPNKCAKLTRRHHASSEQRPASPTTVFNNNLN